MVRATPHSSRTLRVMFSSFLLLFATAAVASADEVKVTVTNLAPADGVLLTPVWIGFHNGFFEIYNLGEPVTAGLEQLAEDGDTSAFMDEFLLAQPGGLQVTLGSTPLAAGESRSINFEVDLANHQYFSYAAMVIPSNDAFIANASPVAHRAFDTTGRFTPIEIDVYGRDVVDAGTEVNDEAEASTAGLGQSVPNTGDVQAGAAAVHPGFLDGGRILTARPDADFKRPGYPIARITVEFAERTTLEFTGDGGQEVPSVVTDASAACRLELTEGEDRVTVECHHDVVDPVAAHVHIGERGENGPVVFAFASPISPISETFPITSSQVEELLAGSYYVNIHTDANPGGEVRAQIDGCFEGPRNLCLLGERFEVSATWETNQGTSGSAIARPATSDSGQFTFFDTDNVELDIKVLGGCAVNDNYWVFIAGLTDVQVDIVVTDTQTGQTQEYSSPLGTPFELVRDVQAFPCSSSN